MKHLWLAATTLVVFSTGCTGTVGSGKLPDQRAKDAHNRDAITSKDWSSPFKDTSSPLKDSKSPLIDAKSPPKDSAPCTGHCKNSKLDCGETWVDCGGKDCLACKPVSIAPMSEKGLYPRMAAPSANRVVVVWETSVQMSIRYACFNGISWSSAASMHPSTKKQENNPWIAEDSKGSFHSVYSYSLGTSRQIHYASYAAAGCGGKWTTEEIVSAKDPFQYSSTFPSVGVDNKDVPYVVWGQSAVPTTNKKCNAQGKCDEPGQQCVSSGVCKPADYRPHMSRRLGGVWEKPMEVTKSLPGYTHYPTVHVVDSTRVHLVWLQAVVGGWRRIYYSSFDGSKWTAPQYTNISAHFPDVRADAKVIHVLADNTRYATRPISGGSFTATKVSSGDLNFMALRLDNTGRLHAVWSNAHRIMYAVKDPTGGWKTAKRISPDTPYHAQPSAAVDPSGYAHLVWAQCNTKDCPGGTGEHGAIWYLRTRYEELP